MYKIYLNIIIILLTGSPLILHLDYYTIINHFNLINLLVSLNTVLNLDPYLNFNYLIIVLLSRSILIDQSFYL